MNLCRKLLLIMLLPAPIFTASAQIVISTPPSGRPARANAPYSAEQETEISHTSADGVHFLRKWRMRVYRDSEGRTREEHFPLAPPGPDEIATIRIYDPIAGLRYELDVRTHQARRFSVNAAPLGASVPRGPSPGPVGFVKNFPARDAQSVSTEFLGTQMIEGLMAEGRRITHTVPAGAQGNDRPFVVVSEHWTSTDLGIEVLRKTSSPESGDVVVHVTNIVRAEPDPNLFQVPADYTIVDQQNGLTP